LDFNLVGTLTTTSKTTTLPGQTPFDCAGLFGNTCGSPLSEWRHEFRVTWESPWDATFSVNWRYFSGIGLDSNTNQPGLTNGTFDPLNAAIPAVSYFDLSGTWQADEHIELRAGITNLLDYDPHIISNLITGSGTPNVYNSYDLLGRTIFLGITGKF
jgi:outer membrane receptor protein involved in Fe transport